MGDDARLCGGISGLEPGWKRREFGERSREGPGVPEGRARCDDGVGTSRMSEDDDDDESRTFFGGGISMTLSSDDIDTARSR